MQLLPTVVKRYIVMALARFDTPMEVSRMVNQEFGLTLGLSHIQRFDPGAAQGKELSAKLRQLFEETRTHFIEEIEKLPLSHRATRLHRLEATYQRAERVGDRKTMLKVLDQARREMEPLVYADVEDDA